MNEIWVWRIGGMILKQAAELFGENPCPSATVSTT
jgi:hypothetical protein